MPAAMHAKIAARLADSIGAASLPDPGAGGSEAAELSTAPTELADAATGALSPLASLAAKPALLAATAFGLGVGAGVGGTALLSNDVPRAASPVAALVVPADAGMTESYAPDAQPMATSPDAAPTPVAKEPTDEADTPRVARPLGKDLGLAKERSLLELSRTAITRGDPDNALQHLAKHHRRYRQGRLAEERDALWIQALALRPGHQREIATRAAAFRRSYPKSLFLSVVNHVEANAQ